MTRDVITARVRIREGIDSETMRPIPDNIITYMSVRDYSKPLSLFLALEVSKVIEDVVLELKIEYNIFVVVSDEEVFLKILAPTQKQYKIAVSILQAVVEKLVENRMMYENFYDIRVTPSLIYKIITFEAFIV